MYVDAPFYIKTINFLPTFPIFSNKLFSYISFCLLFINIFLNSSYFRFKYYYLK